MIKGWMTVYEVFYILQNFGDVRSPTFDHSAQHEPAILFALGEVRTNGLGLWVPPVRRGSTEGVTTALTRPL